MPIISVVIPVYNTKKYLNRCLDSVLGQTLADIEVLCIDDGSSDGSGGILDERANCDSRVHVVHKENSGVAASRNIGLAAARGEYVLFVDSDDYIEAHSCESLLAAARDSDADIVVFGGKAFPSVDWIDRCLSTRDVVYKGDSYNALLEENGSYPLMCNKLYRRAFLEDNGLRFNENLVLGEDNAFQFLAFPCARNVAFSSASLYHYRCEREGSAIASLYVDLTNKVEKHFEVVSYVVREWHERGYISGHKARFLDWILFFLFDDVRNFSFADRIKFAERLAKLLAAHGLDAFDCSPAMRTIASFLLLVSRGLEECDTVVSVLLLARNLSDDEVKKGFLYLANQSEQRLEFFIVDDGSGRSESIASLLEPDDRILVEDNPRDAINRARGRYVIFADFGDRYNWDALSEAISAAENERVDPDVIIMRDALGRLRVTDVFRQVPLIGESADSPIEGVRKHFAFHLGDLHGVVLPFSSLDMCNKLWSLDFVKRCPAVGWDASQVAEMLIRADAAVMCRGILCEKGSSSNCPGDDMSRTLAGLDRVIDVLSREKEHEGYKVQINGLVLSAGMRIVECSSTLGGARDAAQVLLAYVREHDVLNNLPDSLYAAEYDYKAVSFLLEAESLDEALFRHAFSLKARDGAYIQSLEARLEECEEELSCVYGSLSFKLGRQITRLPRVIRDVISRR